MPQAPKSFQQILQELWELLKAYAQQETVGPLKNLGRQIGMGLGGTICFSLGYFLITLGIMRLLQTHTEFFAVHNYATYFVAVLMLALGCVWAGLKAKGKDEAGTRESGVPLTVAEAATGEDTPS